MINPDQLSPEQVQSIRDWAEEGLDLNAIQKRLHEDLGIKLTFMDTRFLLQDLDIQIRQPEPEPQAEQPAELSGATAPPPRSFRAGMHGWPRTKTHHSNSNTYHD